MDIQFSHDAPAQAAVDLLVVGVADGTELSDALQVLGEHGATFAAAAPDFKGKTASKADFKTLGLITPGRLLVVGTGDGGHDDIRRAAGAAGYFARENKLTTAALHLGGLDTAQTRAAVEGFVAGNYRFDKYKTRPDAQKPPCESVAFIGDVDADAVGIASAMLAGQALARDLVNEPAGVLYPETLAEAARQLATDQMTVEVWGEDRIRAERMGGIIAVGQGSSRPPRFIQLHYAPASGAAERTIVLCGKGVTFDAGGLSMKSSAGMQTMRCDMGGSAIVLGVMKAIAELQPNVEVHGIIGAVENMTGANSFKLGDILHIRNGKTVEIHNTDAEGRLVLSDCLSYACEMKPDVLLDFATLTGAAVVALGSYYTALMTNHESLADDLLASASAAGEGLWRLPLEEQYREMLKAEWGDIKNVGGRAAGSITAGLFLSEFVEDGIPWAHLDVAGPTFLDKPSRHFASGGTGQMVSSIVRWLCD